MGSRGEVWVHILVELTFNITAVGTLSSTGCRRHQLDMAALQAMRAGSKE